MTFRGGILREFKLLQMLGPRSFFTAYIAEGGEGDQSPFRQIRCYRISHLLRKVGYLTSFGCICILLHIWRGL